MSQSITSDSYAPYGCKVEGPIDKPDDPSKWHPKLLTLDQVLKRYNGATADDVLNHWPLAFGFPPPTRNYVRSTPGSWTHTRCWEWAENVLDTFDTGLLAFVDRYLPKRRK